VNPRFFFSETKRNVQYLTLCDPKSKRREHGHTLIHSTAAMTVQQWYKLLTL